MARKKKNSGEVKQVKRNSLKVDIALMGFIVLILSMVIFDMFVDDQLFANLMCTVVTLFLIIVTYFLGIVPGLTLNLIFIFVIVLGTIYEYLKTNMMIIGSIFWTVIPPLLLICFYFLTEHIKELQEENFALRRQVGSETVDVETNLWSMDTYLEHFTVLSTLANDYSIKLICCADSLLECGGWNDASS